MEISLSTHLFVFNDIDDSIASLYSRFGYSSAELWAMPPHFPYGDSAEADRIASVLASRGVRIASVHAPLSPDVRTSKNDRCYSLSTQEEQHRRASVAATARAANCISRFGGGT